MDWNSYLQAIQRASDALVAAASLGLHSAVPSCPGWTVRDVVEHTGTVHRHKEQIVRQPVLDTPRSPIDPPKEGLIEWFPEGSEALLATLTNGNWPTALGLGREQALFAGDVESDDANLERNQLKEAESRLAQPIVKPPQPSQRAPKTP